LSAASQTATSHSLGKPAPLPMVAPQSVSVPTGSGVSQMNDEVVEPPSLESLPPPTPPSTTAVPPQLDATAVATNPKSSGIS